MDPISPEHHVMVRVACGIHHISYVRLRKDALYNFQWSITQIFLHIVLDAMLFKLHMKFAPGWVLIWVNFDPIQEIGW